MNAKTELATPLLPLSQQLNGRFAVHELLHSDDEPYPSGPDDLHGNELVGRDIFCGEDGFWRGFEKSDGFEIDAGPILHRGKRDVPYAIRSASELI